MVGIQHRVSKLAETQGKYPEMLMSLHLSIMTLEPQASPNYKMSTKNCGV
jgi:hypothetical protein